MAHEKTFTLKTGRSVKIIAKALPGQNQPYTETEIEVLIKEAKEENYRPAIGNTHPKFWKMKKLDSSQTKILQIKYSGVSEKQIRKTMKEFQERIRSSD